MTVKLKFNRIKKAFKRFIFMNSIQLLFKKERNMLKL